MQLVTKGEGDAFPVLDVRERIDAGAATILPATMLAPLTFRDVLSDISGDVSGRVWSG